MDEKVLNEAVENISLIKGVIDRTSKSFIGFSKIFIYWGMLFILNSAITLFINMNQNQVIDITSRYPLLSYVFPVGIIAILAAIVYICISKRIPLVGLEKHLMKVWLLILIMNVIPAKINIINTASVASDLSAVTIQTNNFSGMLFSLAIALVISSLFTGYKQLMHVGFVYIGISVLYAYFDIPIFNDAVIQALYLLSMPFTFLYTGFFLKSQQARRK